MRITRHWRAALLLAAAATALACGSVPDPDAKPLTQASTGAAAAPAKSQAAAPAAPAYAVPKAADFKLTVKILEKSCYGSAGCNVTYRIALEQVSAAVFDPGKEYDVTYEVRGTEGGKINTLKVTGTSYSTDNKEFASTKSSNPKLTAVITDIVEN